MNPDNKKEIALVYMVAGISSRFLGKIKQFAIINDNEETLIEYSLKQALLAGFSKIIFIVGNKTEKPFKEKFGDSYQGIPVYYALQLYDESERDKPWGTTDALCSAKQFLDCPFVICNGDDIYGENTFKILYNHLKENDEDATIGYKLMNVLSEKGTVNRGIFKIENGYVEELVENFNIEKSNLDKGGLKSEDLCSQNIFALHPKIIDLLYGILIKFKEKNKGDRKIECLLPTDIGNLIKNKEIKVKFYTTKDKWLGVTNPGDENIVKEKLKENY